MNFNKSYREVTMKTKRFNQCKLSLTVLILTMFIQLLIIAPAFAEVSGPGWVRVKADPVSLEDSRAYYKTRTSAPKMAYGVLAITGETAASGALTTVSPEIEELARALNHDPKLIYDYVHNHIDYVPYFGLLKGATLTLLDESGNDFDQAALMIALLRESGYTADFIHGVMSDFSPHFIANWLGVADDMPSSWSADDVLANGGIPANLRWLNEPEPSLYGDIERVWVKATINGVDYVFDPAYKWYNYTSKIDIGAATGYNRADLLSAATSGATVGNNYIQNLNQARLNDKLSEYTTAMVSALHSQYPNSDVRDIIGGRQIIQEQLSDYSEHLPHTSTTISDTWSEVPDAYIAKLRIQHEGIDYTFKIPEIAGKRLSITYAGGSFTPELRLDGVVIATANSTVQGNRYDLIISVDHPYVANNGTHCDQTSTWQCISGSTYAIVSDFGGTTDNLILKRQKQLNQSLASGLGDTSEQVLGETLNIMGLTWMKETLLVDRILAELAETIVIRHHKVAVMAQESGYYIDAKMGLVGIIFRHGIEDDGMSHFNTMVTASSAFEHAILEQLMGSDNPGVSTIKLMHIANSNGSKIFRAHSGNYADIQPQLRNYSAQTLSKIQNVIDNYGTIILPDDGELEINQWRGTGYMSKEMTESGILSLGMIISGDYFGGYGSIRGDINIDRVSENIQSTHPDISYDIETQSILSAEPVDMATGAYMYDRTDIALGDNAPMGLQFSRSYNSSRKWDKRSMGHGWQHNCDIFLKRISDCNPGLGLRTPVDAAAMITDLYIALDLMQSEDSITGWMVMFLGHKWAVDQLVDNAINVNIGGQVTEYIQLPDGSYSNPPGITTQLVDNGDGTFSLKERFGTQMDFDTNGRITQLCDIDGNTLSFTYTGDQLTRVQDAVGRSLTLNYSGENLSYVTDSENRSVHYTYDGSNDLISYKDVAGKIWEYGYDSQHQMASLKNPLKITTAVNVYDTLGRVKTQTVPRQDTTATYNFYFSGFRNVEEDPYGKKIIYYLDEKGRTYAVEDELGSKTSKAFDGQNHVVTVEDARQNTTAFEYDSNQNLTKITNALYKEIINTYDERFRLTDTTDPLTHTTHFDYDSEHHLTQTTDAETNTTSLTYYSNGKVETTTDGRQLVTTLTYDSNNNPLSSRTASHPQISYEYDAIGRMRSLTDQEGSTTEFTYDDRGLLLTRTDPLYKVASFIYDDAGRMTTRTDRNNHTTAYAYTPTDKLETVTYPDTSTVTFTYNLHDKLTGMQDSIGTTTYTYDEVYRLISITNPYGQVISYEYDEVSNITKIIYPGNKAVTYTYDELNRLENVTDWQSQTATYSYDDAGRLTSLTNFNGTVTTYTYDDANRLTFLQNKTSSTGAIFSSYNYTLDGNGNRTNIYQNEPLAPVIPTSTTDFDYNVKRNRLLSMGLTDFTYDDEGQTVSKNSATYAFDYEHRLTDISGGNSAHFTYDGKGNRLQASRNSVVTKYIYDASGNLLAETDSSNNIKKYYIYGRGLLAMVKPTGETYTYHYNGIGSTIAMTDMDKNIVNKYSYTPFGLLANQEQNIPQPFKYAGKHGILYESNGLYYMRARYYDPQTRRFISEDPLGLDAGVNLYAYAFNNPISYVDPLGLCGEKGFLERFNEVLGVDTENSYFDPLVFWTSWTNQVVENSEEIIVGIVGPIATIPPPWGEIASGVIGFGIGSQMAVTAYQDAWVQEPIGYQNPVDLDINPVRLPGIWKDEN